MRNLIRLFAFLDEQLQSFSSQEEEEEEGEEDDHADEEDTEEAGYEQQQPADPVLSRQPVAWRPPNAAQAHHQPTQASQGCFGRRCRHSRPAASGQLVGDEQPPFEDPLDTKLPELKLETGPEQPPTFHTLATSQSRSRKPQAYRRAQAKSQDHIRINLYQSVSFVAAPSISAGSKTSWGPVIDAGACLSNQDGTQEEEVDLQHFGVVLSANEQLDSGPNDCCLEDEGWILLDNQEQLASQPLNIDRRHQLSVLDSIKQLVSKSTGRRNRGDLQTGQVHIGTRLLMALEVSDIELVRSSWAPARKDPVGAGVLLFKGLFTKFPKYLEFFPHFSDLDVEQIQENKRLLKHAIKVIETVTFAIDSTGDETKSSQLNEALTSLVRAHLKRNIGLTEFRNLGIVIIDFICELNSGRVGVVNVNTTTNNNNNNKNENDDRYICQQQSSIIRGLASLSHDDSYSSKNSSQDSGTITSVLDEASIQESPSPCPDELVKLDTNQLVAAWTKFYTIILDLVRREESNDKEEPEEAEDEEEISA